MNSKKIDINNKYYIIITYNNNINRYYRLVDKTKDDKTICESFNRDSFLMKCRNYIKLTNNIECLVASV